jgi:anti-sigma factor RsiW
MGKLHLSFEELSALFDGELPAQAETTARQHLRECPRCSAEYSLSVRLERDLRQPPVLSCATVLEVLSARFDGQANEAERAAGERHLAACEPCRLQLQAWTSAAAAIRALPAGRPSARVDEAIARLVNPPRPVGVRGFPGLPARLAIAGAAIFAIILSGIQPAQAPVATPAIQDGNGVIVAAVQQIVYNKNNNTLYQLDTATAAVNALDPGSYELRARIPVGGEPIRLALFEATNTIWVLDASAKRVTEINAATNMVVSATNVDVAGTPTSINVDNAGKVVVTSVSTPVASAAPVGSVAVLDSATKQLETVREIDVAARMVVVDPLSSQSVLVSAEATKLVDSSYKVIATLPGGVAAAFSRRGDGVAVLSSTGTDTTINFAGAFAPTALRLQGSPRAIRALKEGGYLVLLDIDGQGRVVKVSPDGRAMGSMSVSVAGSDLLYDEATNLVTVANGGTVASAHVLAGTEVAAASPSPTAEIAGSPSPTASSSPPPTATASPAPTGSPDRSPVVAVAPAGVLDKAQRISDGLYSVPVPSGVGPHLMAAVGSRIWFMDVANNVNVFDMRTGQTRQIGKLRSDARVGFWVAGRSFVYGVEPANGQVHVVNTATEQIESYATNVLSPVSAVAVGLDDRLWIALRDLSYLLAFDPRTRGGMDSYDLVDARVSALAIDTVGRVVYSDDVHARVGILDLARSRVTEVPLARRGTTTALIVDGAGTLWLGTGAGELHWVRGATTKLAMDLRMPVTSLWVDPDGRAWFLAPTPNGKPGPGFSYAPADGGRAGRSLPGPAVGLAFDESGKAFSGDPRGGFYVAVEEGR